MYRPIVIFNRTRSRTVVFCQDFLDSGGLNMFQRYLKYFLITAGLLLAISILSGCALMTPTPQENRLDAEAVRSLFSEQTVVSQNVKTGTLSISYYKNDGTVRQLRDGRLRTGKWRVRGNGQKCMQMMSKKESCRVVKQGTDRLYYKYKPDLFYPEPVVVYHSFVPGDRLADTNHGIREEIKVKYEIKALQRALGKKGYSPGPVDGIWGPRSRNALLRYQAINGLQRTGQPDREVYRHITGR